MLRIPLVEHVDDLPSWVPEGARALVGFSMNAATTAPRCVLSSGRRKLRALGRGFEGWSEKLRDRVASQVERIRHWRVIEGDYALAPDGPATWFIDPPYQEKGRYYVHSTVDYAALADWCRFRPGQVIVCENAGANWLPFEPFATLKPGVNGTGSQEVVWTAPRSGLTDFLARLSA